MFDLIHKDKNPEFCIITPLRVNDKISKETKTSVKRNKTPFVWGSYKSDMNIVKNFKAGIAELKNVVKIPNFIIKIDNDTIWNRYTLDHMVSLLKKSVTLSDKKIGYCYCSFEYRGAVNHKFPAIPFDPNRLKQNNYISSNSMFVYDVIKNIEMPDDDYYKRLLDWAYYLKLLNNGIQGIPCQKGYFIAKSNPESISAGSANDFRLKRERVIKDFIK